MKWMIHTYQQSIIIVVLKEPTPSYPCKCSSMHYHVIHQSIHIVLRTSYPIFNFASVPVLSIDFWIGSCPVRWTKNSDPTPILRLIILSIRGMSRKWKDGFLFPTIDLYPFYYKHCVFKCLKKSSSIDVLIHFNRMASGSMDGWVFFLTLLNQIRHSVDEAQVVILSCHHNDWVVLLSGIMTVGKF